MTNLSTRLRVFGPCVVFLALGIAFLPLPGVQNDEALFAAPLYQQNARQFCITVFHKQIVLMVMSYIGALKTALYAPILAIFGGNAWSVRLPMVIAGALTIFFFYYLVQGSADRRIALLAAFLLATDPSFILTDTFDWGPVALEHLCLVTGCFLVLRSVQNPERQMPDWGLGFFVFGLGLWNKAIFGWALAALAVATIAVFWLEIRKVATVRRFAIAGIAFLFGALPFVTYNLRHPFDTLRQNAHREDPAMVLPKLRMLEGTLDGSGLLGFLPAANWADNPKAPRSAMARTTAFLRLHLGEHRKTFTLFAFLIALLMVPWWWRSRPARFALLFMVADWIIMVSTRGAGGAVHHTVLLWPMPQLFIAATFGSAWRRAAGYACIVLILTNLLVINEYLYEFERNGATGNFTDALYSLSDALPDSTRPIYAMDWGMLNTLSLFHRGMLNLRPGDFAFMNDHPDEFERNAINVMFSDPDALFISHVRSREVMKGVRDEFDRTAANAGKREQLVRAIADSNGRPVFEIFRLAPAPAGP